jgi:hypothetical protein
MIRVAPVKAKCLPRLSLAMYTNLSLDVPAKVKSQTQGSPDITSKRCIDRVSPFPPVPSLSIAFLEHITVTSLCAKSKKTLCKIMNHPKTFTESEKSWQCYSACTACLSKQSPSAKCRNPSGSEQHGLDLSPEEQEPVSISIPRLVPDWLNGKFAGIIRNRNISLEKPWFPAELVLSTLHE